MARIASVLDVDHVVNILQRRCNDQGIRLKWTDDQELAATNGKEIILPKIQQPVTKAALDKLYGFVIHEAGHHTRPEIFDIARGALEKGATDGMMALLNIIEDDAMEREVSSKYRGDAAALGNLNSTILTELADVLTGFEIPEEATTEDMAPMTACGVSQLSRTNWDGYSTEARAAYFAALPDKAATEVNTLAMEGWHEKMQDVTDPHSAWDLTIDLYKRLYPDADDDELEEIREAGHKGPTESGEEGDSEEPAGGSDGVPNDEAGDTSGNAGDGEETEEGDAEGKATGGEGKVVSWKDFVLSEHNEWKASEPGQFGSIGIDWSDYDGDGSLMLMPQHLINVVDCRKGKGEDISTGFRGSPDKFLSNNAEARRFGSQIRRYIQAKARTQVVREKYHGKLDKSSLVRLALPPIDGGEYNKRVFYDWEDQKELNTCIHVLTDWSGSMNGRKMKYAADASGRLVFTFDRILRVPVQLAAFSNRASECDIGLIKGFNDRSVSPQDIADSFSKFYRYTSANNDADAVMWAYNQLKRRKEDRKILLVLSDGCPAGAYNYSSGHLNLQAVTSQIEKEGKIELYGVGICSDAVESYYTNTRVLKGPDEINSTLMNIIKDGAYK